MTNLNYLINHINFELKQLKRANGIPPYCLFGVDDNKFEFILKDIPNELDSYFNKDGKIILDGNSKDSSYLENMMKVLNYFRNKVHNS